MSVDTIEEYIAKLKAQVDAELASPNIAAHKHGRPIGYADGCKGPLCLKQHRDRIRSQNKNMKASNPIRDAYLEQRLAEYQESLKKGTEVA
ncbi:hypothetical protein SEA_JELLYBONES_3 [Gordonia phage Jellybones]|uniref:Uncharacterized protein n=1 Tax=Gordonia phage Jellybones TaxID=2653716 RepID=A0A5Q2WCG8_9CAUD|nr:hypothetical protein HWC76_gp003 [Gordonia phage Jellybones]QGH76146.1 hypothetical protein SEA_JELLYBONES_3 [Gordonia phage Jellybones]